MKVVELYIMRRVLAMFAATLFWVLAIVWTTQILTRVNVVTDGGQSIATFLEIAWLVLPAVVPVVMPFAVGIAVAQTLSTMNTDSELVVLTAAGSSRMTVIRPVLIIAVASSVLSFAVNNFVEPHSRERLRVVMAEARSELITTVIQEGSFEKIEDGLFLQIGKRLPDGRLGGIFVSDSRDADAELIYYANQGTPVEFEGEHVLVMEDGVVHRQNAQGEISVVRFQTYAFDMSQFAPTGNGVHLHAKDRTLGFLLDPDPEDAAYERFPGSFHAELHRRLSEWLYPLVFGLLALAVAGDARSFREARVHPLLTTMAVALGVRWAGFFVAGNSDTVPAYIYLGYAIPIAASLVAVYFIATNRMLEVPTAISDRIVQSFERLRRRGAELRLAFARDAARGGGQ